MKPRAAIVTPHTGSFVSGYVSGLLGSLRAGHIHEVVHLPGSVHMGATRGKCAEQALSGQAEVMLWVDSDISFTPEDAHRLIEACDESTPFVTGIYAQVTWEGKLAPLVFQRSPRTEDWQAAVMSRQELDPSRGIIPVGACGFGFVATHRSMLEALLIDGRMRAFYERWDGDEMVGEDIAFCEAAHGAGYPLLCDTKVRVRHIKTVDIGI